MNSRKHAIVIGASMGGMLAARALADHFDRVTLVERDSFPEAGEQRRGVPQGRHTHGLLASGREVLERFFPGITDELGAAGAVRCDAILKGRWFQQGDFLPQFASGTEGICLSRPLLEGTVRRRLLANPRAAFCENTVVEALETTPDRARVTGIRTAQGVIPADLVVDATGRGSHGRQWLEATGYVRPSEDSVEIQVAYTTRLFRRRASDLAGDAIAVVPPTPEGKRSGVMLAQEGDRWTVTLIGFFGNVCPQDLPGFLEFAGSIPSPVIYETIRSAEPLGDAASARFPTSVRRRYERLSRFPEGYLAFGDALCSFNPIYGQGMSVAALEAVELSRAIAEGPTGLARRFFTRAAKVIDIPWSIAVGTDLTIPEAVGPRTPKLRFVNWYMSKLLRAAHGDTTLALAFHNVANLVAPPESVMRPGIVARVVAGSLRSRESTTRPQARAARA